MTRIITSIEPSADDPNFRDVYVDRKIVITLPSSSVKELNIEVDQTWTQDLALFVASKSELLKARRMAIDLISRRAWGSNELATRLVKRGVPKEIASQTTQELADDDWLDDLVYARALIRQWTRKEPAGSKWLRHKLHGKEIPENVASEALQTELSGQSEQETATALAAIRLAKAPPLDDHTLRRKIISALSRRGFALDVASEALRRAQSDDA